MSEYMRKPDEDLLGYAIRMKQLACSNADALRIVKYEVQELRRELEAIRNGGEICPMCGHANEKSGCFWGCGSCGEVVCQCCEKDHECKAASGGEGGS